MGGDNGANLTGSRPERQAAPSGRHPGFVGRHDELAALLQGPPDRPATITWVHGQGGVGKTTLVREAARQWRSRDVELRWFEATDIPNSEPAIDHVTGLGSASAPFVAVFDDAWHLTALPRWCATRAPQLAPGSRLVLIDRQPPEFRWRVSPEVASRLQMIELDSFSAAESEALLTGLRVPSRLHGALHRITYGNPLALALVGEVFLQAPEPLAEPRSLGDLPDVVEALFETLARNLPSDRHRQALRAGAYVLAVTEQLLREVVDEADASALFDWLQGLAFVRRTAQGLRLHDLVRDTVAADLHWRDPQGADDLAFRLFAYFGGRLEADPSGIPWVGRELRELGRRAPKMKAVLFHPGGYHEGPITPAGPADEPVIEAMIETLEGPESLACFRYWRARGALTHVLRDPDGSVAAFASELEVNGLSAEDAAADPPVRRMKRAMRQWLLEDTEQVLLFRHWMARDAHQAISPAQSALFTFFTVRSLTTPAVSFGSAVHYDPDPFEEVANQVTLLRRVPGTDHELDGRPLAVFANDFRGRTAREWLIDHYDHAVKQQPSAGTVLLPPLEHFTRFVRQALRDLQDPLRLADNPLVRSPLVPKSASDPARLLAEKIRRACLDVRDGPFEDDYELLLTAYLEPRKQRAAAVELDISYATYRRHLGDAVKRLADGLWRAAGGR